MSCHLLLQGIFLTQWLNTGLLHCRGQSLSLRSAPGPFYSLCLRFKPGEKTKISQKKIPDKPLTLKISTCLEENPRTRNKKGAWGMALTSSKPLELWHCGSTHMSSALMTVLLAVTGGKQVRGEAEAVRPVWLKEAVLSRHYHCCFSVAQMCPTLCDPMDCSMPGFPCPSPTPRACSNSCPLSRWHHPTISSSVIPFSSCLQSFSGSGSFLMSQLFTSGGQSIAASASASVLPLNIQDWFPLGWTGLISLLSWGLSRVFSNTTIRKHQFFNTQPSLWSNSHICTWLLEKL